MESLGFFARAHDVPLARLLSELKLAANDKMHGDEQLRPSLADNIYRPFFLAGIVTVLTLGAMGCIFVVADRSVRGLSRRGSA